MFAALSLLLLGVVVASIVCCSTAGESECRPDVAGSGPAGLPSTTLRVLTLNLAHGRGKAWHQSLVGRESIRENLDAVARLLERESPHVVALQEADGPSFWSGNFDHIAYLAEQGAMVFQARAKNVDGLGISFGTALLSSAKLENALAVTFEPSLPTFSKGFVLATVAVEDPTGRRREIDVVSVHLDFSRASVRRAQVEELIARISTRNRPVIVMGDFNSGWSEGSPLRELADRLDLRTDSPEAPLVTFPSAGSRLDWILISKKLRMLRHEVLTDPVSDHRAVLAEVTLGENPDAG